MSSARAVKLQSVPPPRSPAREKLAQVIARNKEAAHAIGKLETALREASQRRWQARSALERAQEAAREAREAQARHVIDSALGEAGSEPLSPEAAQAAIECAEEQFENAGRAVATLEREIQSYRERNSLRDGQLSAAIERVIQSDPAVTSFLRAFAQRQIEFADWQAALDAIRLRLSAEQIALIRPDDHAPCPFADAWKQKLAALRNDADTEFPEPGIWKIERVIVDPAPDRHLN